MNLLRNNKTAVAKKFLSFFILLLFGVFVIPMFGVSAADMEDNDGMFYSDFNSLEETTKAALDLNVRIVEEAAILMKNDGVLPFNGITNITVLGRNSTDLAYGGGGSGGGNTDDAVSFFDSLEVAGLNINPKVRSFYENYDGPSKAVPGMWGGGASTIGEVPIEEYTREITESFNIFNDAAVIVITRSGSEGGDSSRENIVDNEDKTMHYLELSENELDLIDLAKANFDKIVVIINNSAPLELGVLEDDPAINGILWIGHPGNNGIMALGRILNGEVNPSGRTPDIYPEDFTADPTYQNFSDNSQLDATHYILEPDGDDDDSDPDLISGPRGNVPVLMYEEGIYMGYRYYETRGVEEGGTWYEDNVVYPFGYGLSYTDFSWEVVNQYPTEAALLGEDEKIELDVKVTNTGDVAGKDVVQLYFTAPYITGEIEKAHVVLAGFEKTGLIQPGKSEIVKLTLHVQDMASYDYNDANGNGHFGYELDEGAYQVKLMKNSHEAVITLNYTVPVDGFQYTTSRITGNTVENRFSDGKFDSLPQADGVSMNPVMTRSDFAGTFPTTPTIADLTIPADSDLKDVVNYIFSLDDIESTDPWYRDATDAVGLSQIAEDVEIADRVLPYMLKDMMGVDKDDPKWSELLNSLKWSEIKTLISNGRYQTARLDIIGKETDSNQDGPAGSRGGIYWASETVIAATWNVDLVEKFGQMIGNESLWLDIQGWYAPAMNIHRSPFSGRNFEYYSEDGFLSGKIAAASTIGAQSKGLYVFLKHFAVNDQETDRMSILTYLDEQTMREIYLRAFQIPVEEGNANAIMSAFNYIGDRPAAQNYALLTEVLRNEWGFNGVVVTDYYSGGQGLGAYQNINEQIVMGNDIPLGSVNINNIFGTWDETEAAVVYTSVDPVTEVETILPSYSFWLAGREAALNVLYVAANSNSVKNGVDFDFHGALELDEANPIALDEATQFSSFASNLVPEDLQGSAPYSFTLDEDSALPAGLNLNSDGTLTGTPSVYGSFTFEVQVSAYDWIDGGTITYSLDIASAFAFTGDALDTAEVGEAFNVTISSDVFVVNPNFNDETHADYHVGYNEITYSERDNSLPEGLEISEAGVISGTPTTAGVYEVTLRVSAEYWNAGGWRPGLRTANTDFVIIMTVTDDTVVEPPLTIEDLKAMIDDLVILSEAQVNALIDAKVLTEANVNTLIDAKVLTETQINALIDAKVLTETQIQALIDDAVLTETQIITLIEENALSEEQIQALIDADLLTEADVQALIDASLPEDVADTGCGSQANASASIIIFTFVGLLGLFFVRRKF